MASRRPVSRHRREGWHWQRRAHRINLSVCGYVYCPRARHSKTHTRPPPIGFGSCRIIGGCAHLCCTTRASSTTTTLRLCTRIPVRKGQSPRELGAPTPLHAQASIHPAPALHHQGPLFPLNGSRDCRRHSHSRHLQCNHSARVASASPPLLTVTTLG